MVKVATNALPFQAWSVEGDVLASNPDLLRLLKQLLAYMCSLPERGCMRNFPGNCYCPYAAVVIVNENQGQSVFPRPLGQELAVHMTIGIQPAHSAGSSVWSWFRVPDQCPNGILVPGV
jgi:porphobilinogen deaminase